MPLEHRPLRTFTGRVKSCEVLREIGKVSVPACGVRHEVEGFGAKAGDDGVVDDPAGFGRKQAREGRVSNSQDMDRRGCYTLEKGGGGRAGESVLYPRARG